MKSKNKRLKQWIDIRNNIVIPMFDAKGIHSCELKLSPNCTKTLFTGFAHKRNRNVYYKHPELLGKFNHIILACSNCHLEIDINKELKEKIFLKLRDEIV